MRALTFSDNSPFFLFLSGFIPKMISAKTLYNSHKTFRCLMGISFAPLSYLAYMVCEVFKIDAT